MNVMSDFRGSILNGKNTNSFSYFVTTHKKVFVLAHSTIKKKFLESTEVIIANAPPTTTTYTQLEESKH